ncbi:hypothetical protein BYT27DRAFT_7251461 [Phlegmacium glaucopus]|nr:hypothetical protein BYT27DRAFT_7251461 [Phlegmacium glaucopus]
MPPKTTKPKIPDIPWGDDNDRLVWAFLTECEKDINYKVLFGKKETMENTSGDSKITMFKQIAQVILPELFAVDGTMVANRLKGQLERLMKMYQKHAARLQQTGGGLEDESSQDERLKYYIPGLGPDESTPGDAVNLWCTYFLGSLIFNLMSLLIEQIEKDFKFFPRLHRIFASCPKVTPIVITTALGPQGQKTVWYQSPDDAPTSHATNTVVPTNGPPPSTPAHSTPACSPSRTFGTDVTQAVINETPDLLLSTPATLVLPLDSSARHAPKSSGVSREAIEKVHSYIEMVPQKQTLLDTLIELQEKNTKMWNDEMKEKLLIQKQAHVLE